ncbi:CRISPR type I-D/CYANO-associated protein Csc1 [Seinonella peptonophila]|uniref:CRISPR type I-D/CYANO-associated protein Csc1 n=1 Tax=Seinonella peptonophila TaxID=112248 RepID=A0A1M5B4Z8_9BACL|nr:type I-D CRISPR-associated protein Cas5/Csc1 [Seinonella peptonophila]SHF37584.1 CRISPR type I-D/CYANO-associated protein Csc1 [Seinonella peptonophila]
MKPGSQFETYLLSQEPIELPRRIRLGKWMSQASVKVEQVAIKKSYHTKSTHLLNLADLVELPNTFGSLYNILPTRLLKMASWQESLAGYKLTLPKEEKNESLFLPESVFIWRVQR